METSAVFSEENKSILTCYVILPHLRLVGSDEAQQLAKVTVLLH